MKRFFYLLFLVIFFGGCSFIDMAFVINDSATDIVVRYQIRNDDTSDLSQHIMSFSPEPKIIKRGDLNSHLNEGDVITVNPDSGKFMEVVLKPQHQLYFGNISSFHHIKESFLLAEFSITKSGTVYQPRDLASMIRRKPRKHTMVILIE